MIFANERSLRKWNPERMLKEAIDEAKNAESEGASFTGGNPLLVVNRVIELGQGLKKHFGTGFHLHLYAPAHRLQNHWLDKLCSVIDEIRFHVTSLNELDALEKAFLKMWDVGIEVPAFPGQEDFLRELATWLEKKALRYEKTSFLNINELELSESNFQFLQKGGFKRKKDSIAAVAGSDRTAKAVIQWASEELERTTVHYCPSAAKDGIQLPNRLLRLARNVAKPFDIIREDGPHRGLLIRGVIQGARPLTEQQKELLRSILLLELKIPQAQVIWDAKKNRFLVNPIILEDLALEIRKLAQEKEISLRIGIAEEYPTANGLETEFDPL